MNIVESATVDQLQSQIDYYQNLIKQKKSQANSLQGQIESMNNQIYIAELNIQKYQKEIYIKEKEISDTQVKIKQKEKELAYQKSVLDESLRVIYEEGNAGFLESFLTAQTLSDLIDRTEYLDTVSNKVEVTMGKIAKIKSDLVAKKNDLKEKKNKLSSLLAEQRQTRESLILQKSSKDQLLVQTQGQEVQYKKIIDNLHRILNEIYNSRRGAPVGSQLVSSVDYDWYYNQTNYPNVYLRPSSFTIKEYGCLITSIAMVATKYGHYITPPGVVDASNFNYDGGWLGFRRDIGVTVGWSRPINWGVVNSELNNGHPVIISVKIPGVPSYNSDGSNHFIVIKGTSDGKYLIHDPYWTNGSYDLNQVRSMKIVTNH